MPVPNHAMILTIFTLLSLMSLTITFNLTYLPLNSLVKVNTDAGGSVSGASATATDCSGGAATMWCEGALMGGILALVL